MEISFIFNQTKLLTSHSVIGGSLEIMNTVLLMNDILGNKTKYLN